MLGRTCLLGEQFSLNRLVVLKKKMTLYPRRSSGSYFVRKKVKAASEKSAKSFFADFSIATLTYPPWVSEDSVPLERGNH